MLVWSALLCLLLRRSTSSPLEPAGGLAGGSDNRDVSLESRCGSDAPYGRYMNLVENLRRSPSSCWSRTSPQGERDDALGATLLLLGRVAHAAVYVAGIPYFGPPRSSSGRRRGADPVADLALSDASPVATGPGVIRLARWLAAPAA